MGTWSPDILGSDDALDVLGTLADTLKIETLYPLRFEDDKTAETVASALKKNENQVLKNEWEFEDYLIIAAVYMAAGGDIPTIVKEHALEACRAEIKELETENSLGWQNPQERIDVLKNYENLLNNYKNGQRIDIEHKGLFEKLNEIQNPPEKEAPLRNLVRIDKAFLHPVTEDDEKRFLAEFDPNADTLLEGVDGLSLEKRDIVIALTILAKYRQEDPCKG